MTAPSSDKPTCGGKKRGGGFCTRPAGWGTDHVGQGRCKLHAGSTPIKHGRYSTVKRPRIRELLDAFDNDPDPLDIAPEIKLLRALILDYIERYDEQTDALLAWHASFNGGFLQQYQDWGNSFRDWLASWTLFQESFASYRQSVEQAQVHYKLGWPEPPKLPALIDPPGPPEPGEDPATKPRRVTDILEVGKFIQSIGALVERIEKRQQNGTITLSTLDEVLQKHGVEAAQAAAEVIHDDALRTALLDAIGRRWGAIIMPAGGGSANSSR